MIFGAALGFTVALAIVIHIGAPNASWLVNVALAKITLVAAGGLMAAGAVAVRIDNRNRTKELQDDARPNEVSDGR
ncbi:MAG: hypothetical protein ACREMS_08705 [Gemmatimonadaceae bacterium]